MIDVTRDSEAEEISQRTMELQEKMKDILMPLLAGCIEEGNGQDSNKGICNTLVDAEDSIEVDCLPESGNPCHRSVIHLDISVPRTNSSDDFSDEIMEKCREVPLVELFVACGSFPNEE